MEYRWYAIQTTAGHENKVRNLLQKRIEDDPRPVEQKLIRQALVPVQDVIEIKNGKKVTVERKLYPGYVLVEMAMSQEALHVVNSIQGVIKFVGTGKLPQPLRQDEVNRLLGIAEAVAESEPKEEIPFMVGQVVEITEGPFSDFSGTVEEVLADKGKVKVSVSLFGRPTAVELDYLQLGRRRHSSGRVPGDRCAGPIAAPRPRGHRGSRPTDGPTLRGEQWQRRSRHWSSCSARPARRRPRLRWARPWVRTA